MAALSDEPVRVDLRAPPTRTDAYHDAESFGRLNVACSPPGLSGATDGQLLVRRARRDRSRTAPRSRRRRIRGRQRFGFRAAPGPRSTRRCNLGRSGAADGRTWQRFNLRSRPGGGRARRGGRVSGRSTRLSESRNRNGQARQQGNQGEQTVCHGEPPRRPRR
jgi:hypothetical protein